MRNNVFLFTAIFCMLSAGANAAAPPNLIQNGGFETGANPSSYDTYQKGSKAIPGWTITFGTVDVMGPNWHPADGGKNSVDVDGTPGPGGISQSFATSHGSVYAISFELAGNPECGPALKRLTVTAGPARHQYVFDSSHTSDSKMGWQLKSFQFKANASRTTLTFSSTDPKGSMCGPAIDAVRAWKVN